MRLILFGILLVAACCVRSGTATSYGRIYTRTFTYEDGRRWEGGKSPCFGDSVEFDADQFISVKVDSSASITNMYLPMNGEIILGEKAIMGPSKDLSSCTGKGQTVKFNSNPDSWFNARNWEAHNLADGNPIHVQTFLDTESVPCDFDQVTFKDGETWTISIPTDITVNRFAIAGQKYDSQSLSAYRNTGAGRYQFVGDGLVAINPTTCQDATGCYCRTALHYNQVAQFICSNTPCSEPQCDDAILPSGQCCDVCGGSLSMNYSPGAYTEVNMINFLATQSNKFSGTHFALSKQRRQARGNGDDVIQIMLTDDSGNGYQAKQLAQAIMDLLTPTNDLGVSDVTIIVSGQGHNEGLTGGTIAGIVIATLLVLVLLITAGYCYKTGRSNFKMEFPSAFWRRTPQGGEINPMYDMSSEGSNDGQEAGPGSSNRDSSTTATQQITKDTGLPQALQSDFGVSFPNPSYLEEDL